jgi:tmRNA-binding protein
MVALALEVFVTKSGFIKLKIGIWRLHRKVEKKQILKERDIKRQMEKDIRSF